MKNQWIFIFLGSALFSSLQAERSIPSQFHDRHYVDPNSYWNGASSGYYGGVIDNGAVIIDPNAGSGAGMTDDSDELYQSYLNNFGVTH